MITGSEVKLKTDRIGSQDGTVQELEALVVGRRIVDHGLVLDIQLLPKRRVAFVAPAATPTYASATDAQREYGFACDGTTQLMPDGSEPYEVR